MDVGQKDMKKGVRAILQEIFQLPRMNRKKLIGDIINKGVNVKTGAGARFHYMLHLVSGNTEYEKTMQGTFNCQNVYPSGLWDNAAQMELWRGGGRIQRRCGGV